MINSANRRNKDWYRTKEYRENMSKVMKGKNTWTKGRKRSPETRKKMSEAQKKRGIFNWKVGRIPWNKGKKRSLETSEKQSGINHWNWNGGITPLRKKLYFSKEYKLWRKSVFERDNYTCIWCGKRGGKLEADHIKPFCDYPELRFAIDNGRTLCNKCHKTTDTYGYKTVLLRRFSTEQEALDFIKQKEKK